MGFCSVEIVQKGLFHRFHVVLLKVIWLWYPSGRHLYEAISWKKIISCTRIVCIERVRWGWGRSGKCACHVTQRKCDGVLFSENCSEGMVSSISSGFIKSYLALIPIRTAFISSYIMKIGPILNAYCMYRHGIGWGWGRSGKCACHVTQRKCDGVLFSGNCSEGVVPSFSCGFLKSYLALIPIRTAFIWSYIIKKFISCTRIVCIERVRWGWGRSGKCACHVTQRKCDGVLFSGNCSEGVVLSFSRGFIESYLALIPIRTAFIWSYIKKKKSYLARVLYV